MTIIADRLSTVENRATPEHWEDNLIYGTTNQTATGTLVERTTCFTMSLLPARRSHRRTTITKKMSGFPGLLRKSATWDQDSEMARHAGIKTALDLDGISVPHAHPDSAAPARTPTAYYAKTSLKVPT
jgi:IS30 family transposase